MHHYYDNIVRKGVSVVNIALLVLVVVALVVALVVLVEVGVVAIAM